MKQSITVEQLEELSPAARHELNIRFRDSIEYDDTLVDVYIPSEKHGPSKGVFQGLWGNEVQSDGTQMCFEYPEKYIGKIKNHQGLVLPLMNVGQLIQFLHERDSRMLYMITYSLYQCTKESPLEPRFMAEQLVDILWEACKVLLETD